MPGRRRAKVCTHPALHIAAQCAHREERSFWRLVVPLARPGLAVAAFYTFLTAWGEVAYASKFMTSENKYTLPLGMHTYVGQFKAEWGDPAAAFMMVAVPALIVFYVVQKYLVSGLTAGGTKG